jgi:hypothetical protein
MSRVCCDRLDRGPNSSRYEMSLESSALVLSPVFKPGFWLVLGFFGVNFGLIEWSYFALNKVMNSWIVNRIGPIESAAMALWSSVSGMLRERFC